MSHCPECAKLQAQLSQAQQQLAEAREDKEILDWQEKTAHAVGYPTPGNGIPDDQLFWIFTNEGNFSGETLRAAYRAAMKEAK